MRLLVQLLSGEVESCVEAAEGELVWQLLGKAKQALGRPRIRWLVTTAGVRLFSSATLAEAGLADGDRLTAVIGPPPQLVFLNASADIGDAQAVRGALARAGGPCRVWLLIGGRYEQHRPATEWAWPELCEAEELEVGCVFDPTDGLAVAAGLAHMPHLRKLKLTAQGDFWEALKTVAVPNLEELHICCCGAGGHDVAASLRCCQRLRVLAICAESAQDWNGAGWQQLLDALPACLEELTLSLPADGLAPMLPALPLLQSFSIKALNLPFDTASQTAIKSLLATLPPTLQALHLNSIMFAQSCNDTWLAEVFRGLPGLRRVSLPMCDGSQDVERQAMLKALPCELEELRVPLPTTWCQVEAIRETLSRLQQLKRLAFLGFLNDPDQSESLEYKVRHPREEMGLWETLVSALPTSLEQLEVPFCGLSPRTANITTNQFQRLPRLSKVDLSGNPDGLLALMSGLPDTIESVVLDAYDFADVDVALLRTLLSEAQLDCLKRAELRFCNTSFFNLYQECEESFKNLFA